MKLSVEDFWFKLVPAVGGGILLFLETTGKAFMLYALGVLALAIARVLPAIL